MTERNDTDYGIIAAVTFALLIFGMVFAYFVM